MGGIKYNYCMNYQKSTKYVLLKGLNKMKKVKVNVADCNEGQMLASDIFDETGRLIVVKNTAINDYIKNRLLEMGIKSIYVFYNTGNHSNPVEFKESYEDDVNLVKEIINELSSGKGLNYENVKLLSDNIYESVKTNYEIIDCLNEVKRVDEYTYYHSLNVSLYSMLIGRWLELSEESIKDLIQAGILHDVGKCRISKEILNKKDALLPDEFEKIKMHPVYGYVMAKTIPNLNDDIPQAILTHHEREDGSGYPFGLKGDELNLYSKIIAISDVYDALTSERAYKSRQTPFDSLRTIQNIGYGYFDTKILMTFLSNISSYYIGSKVLMNTGDSGYVAYVDPLRVYYPIVCIKSDYYDLSKEKSLKIDRML
ncbi:MAG TPA: HD-GYP domain-containing protein [Clostridiaceae bacterium]|jgi:HD-GYP domain-containing protein (c-di-GMP phosphodiesterase class II)|nr:HD-GYP domain-containing protein [Clostridiaceae bacterium]HBF77126.1 HD-GYP domain-containing protein [Clostridiaceae bacterium]HBG38811.1 HD-GYP domain-containing protein [Clostridiaceae bacterium]HBN28654.1 HD-GYP domain-containing protein [Clostridiaceae bacterium]HBX47366.1 HD-GYP domain-containing protein [Clostridiaceae bacterium]